MCKSPYILSIRSVRLVLNDDKRVDGVTQWK